MAFLDNTGVARLVTDLKGKLAAIVHTHAASDITSGTLGVARGGTGKATHTSNAVITGNGTNAVNNVATADGALYATAANGAAQFGTLPIAQGGTAGTTKAEARENLEVPVNSSIATVESATATANHAIGDHFMLDDKLKTATAAIATGETINATNSADATVQGQIDALRDSVTHANAVTVASGFTGSGNAIRNGVVTSIDMSFTATSNVMSGQFVVGTIQSAVRPKLFTTFVVPMTHTSADFNKFVGVDISADGTIRVTSQHPTGGVHMISGATIWLRGLYMSS